MTGVLPLDEGLLRADGISVRYGSTTALTEATVTIAPGQVWAVTGPSGSGKSTLLLCLAGIVRPSTGRVRYRGRDLGELREPELASLRRSAFGVLFQFGQLVPEMSLGENVALPLLQGGRRPRRAASAALAMLDRLGIAELASSKPSAVSGSQAQRAALARAMITSPEVLFADEPTGSLDVASGRLVLEEMTALAREHGSAIVLATHDAGIAATADREIHLCDGRVVASPGNLRG